MKILHSTVPQLLEAQNGYEQYLQLKQIYDLSVEDFLRPTPESYNDDNGILHIYVNGFLSDVHPRVQNLLGNQSYEFLLESLEGTKAKGLFIHVRSGGGMACGVAEVCDKIESLGIPTLAYGSGIMGSAAYRIAASCDWVGASQSTDVGSIGTVLAFIDKSPLLKAAGARIHVFTNEGATYKGIGLDELSKEQAEYLQSKVNQSGNEFKEYIKTRRPHVSEQVFSAITANGEQAGELGLVDFIGTEKEAYDFLLGKTLNIL